jgi:hypothetical protein
LNVFVDNSTTPLLKANLVKKWILVAIGIAMKPKSATKYKRYTIEM